MSPAAIRDLLRARRPGHNLPRAFYVDPALYEADLAAIWFRDWLFVGVEGEVAAPGQYITLSVARSPIIVVRDGKGQVRGFHNCCRHRGARILDAASGTARELVSPSHGWTYRLDGSLVEAPFMPDDFDKGAFGLKPLHLRLVAGMILVCLADHAPEIGTYAGAIEGLMEPHDLARAKVALEERKVVRGNWKLVLENSRELSHQTPRFHDPADIAAFRTRMIESGLPSHAVEGRDFRSERLPSAKGSVSATVDGQPAVALRLGRVPTGDVGSLHSVHYPNTVTCLLGDYAVLVRILPLGPEATEVSTRWLVNPAAVEGRDFDLPRLRKVWSLANEEDAARTERNQAGMHSVGYLPGPCSPLLEGGVTRFLDWYCARLDQEGAG